jgi:hypothetical protein
VFFLLGVGGWGLGVGGWVFEVVCVGVDIFVLIGAFMYYFVLCLSQNLNRSSAK